jgi:hypothetical protein
VRVAEVVADVDDDGRAADALDVVGGRGVPEAERDQRDGGQVVAVALVPLVGGPAAGAEFLAADVFVVDSDGALARLDQRFGFNWHRLNSSLAITPTREE